MVEWTREQMLMIRQPPDPNHSTESERVDGSANIHLPANVLRPAKQPRLGNRRHSFAFGEERIQVRNQAPVLRGGGDEKATWFKKALACFICCITSSSDEVDDPSLVPLPASDSDDDDRHEDNEVNDDDEGHDHNREFGHERPVLAPALEDPILKFCRERPLSPLTNLSASDCEDAQGEIERPVSPVNSIRNGSGSSDVNPDYIMSVPLPVAASTVAASPETEYYSPDSEERERVDEQWRREEHIKTGSSVIARLRGGGVDSSTRSMRAGQWFHENIASHSHLKPPSISRRTGRLAEPSERPRDPNKLYCLPKRNNAEDGTRSRRKWFKVKEDAAETWVGIKRQARPRSTLLFLGRLLSTPFLGALDSISAEPDDENTTYESEYFDYGKAGLRTYTTKYGTVHKVPSIRITAPSPSPMLRGTGSS
jgi:hypothetical protein